MSIDTVAITGSIRCVARLWYSVALSYRYAFFSVSDLPIPYSNTDHHLTRKSPSVYPSFPMHHRTERAIVSKIETLRLESPICRAHPTVPPSRSRVATVTCASIYWNGTYAIYCRKVSIIIIMMIITIIMIIITIIIITIIIIIII